VFLIKEEHMFVIAGATGRTGGVVARTLLSQNQPVRVLVRDAGKARAWRDAGAEVEVASLTDAAALARAVEGAKGFYALLPEEVGVPDFHGHRRAMAKALATAAKSVPHVVFLSSLPAVLSEGNGPAADLHAAESALRAATKTTVVRACFFMENVLMAMAPARHEGVYPSLLPSADLPVPMIATADVGRFAARCLVEPPAKSEVVDLIGPMYSSNDCARLLGTALGRALKVVDVPAEAQVGLFIKAGLPEPFARSVAELNACMASGRVTPRGDRMVPATTRLEEVLPGLLQ
jgi:uncharacterized protein YbjT (DUF2867 family)